MFIKVEEINIQHNLIVKFRAPDPISGYQIVKVFMSQKQNVVN